MKHQDNQVQSRQWIMAAVDRYEQPLARYAQRMLSDEHAARDAVQFTFLKLCDRPQDASQERLAAWLFTVCRNRVLDMVRQAEKLQLRAETEERHSNEPDPADLVENADVHARLLALVEQLPAGQREAIDLWTHGFSYREIADITERGEGAVRVLVHRALMRLRQHPVAQAIVRAGQRGQFAGS